MAYGNFGGFGGGNIQNLMRQAQKMQEDMQRKRAELDAREFSASVGGGMVEIVMTGNKKVKAYRGLYRGDRCHHGGTPLASLLAADRHARRGEHGAVLRRGQMYPA